MGLFDFHEIFVARIFTQGNSWDILQSLAKNPISCKTFCSINTRCHRNFKQILFALHKSNSFYDLNLVKMCFSLYFFLSQSLPKYCFFCSFFENILLFLGPTCVRGLITSKLIFHSVFTWSRSWRSVPVREYSLWLNSGQFRKSRWSGNPGFEWSLIELHRYCIAWMYYREICVVTPN